MCLPKEPVDNGTERYQDEQMVRADDGPTLVSLAEPFYFSAGNACPADRRSPEVETHNRWNVWLIGFRRWFGLRVPKRSWKIRGHLFHSSVSSDSDPLSFAEGFRLFSDARGSVRPETRAQGGCHHQI